MNVALIAPPAVPIALGARLISSDLKRRGHTTRMVFLPMRKLDRFHEPYGPELLDDLVKLVRDADVIAITVMTNTFLKATQISEAVRSAGLTAPVVWGGVHPSAEPESCLPHADLVCVGEGERPMASLLETLAAGGDPSELPNFVSRRNGEVLRNDVLPLDDDLDAAPFADYDLDDGHYVRHRGRLVPARPELLGKALVKYRIVTTRGCPYDCAFCCNGLWRRLYQGKGPWVRRRSVENVVEELAEVRRRFAVTRGVSIVDDTFFVRSAEEIGRFAELYRSQVGLPFEINTHPATLTREKIDPLVAAGCRVVEIGLQSGCEQTNVEIFNRRTSQECMARALDLLADTRGIRVQVHYILDNPFEPEAWQIETLRFAARHHRRGFESTIFPLVMFPGSALHARAKAEGVSGAIDEAMFQTLYTGREKRRFTRLGYVPLVLAMVLRLRRWGAPRWLARGLVEAMVWRPGRFVLDRRWFMLAAAGASRAGRMIYHGVDQALLRPLRKLARRRAARA